MLILREILSDGQFESDSRTLLRKPAFFFGNLIEEDEAALYDGKYKWLRQIGNRKFFLPNMEGKISLGLSATYICASDNGLGLGQATLWSLLGQDRCP